MEARDVIDVVLLFEQAGIDIWVEGGWGIDALLGTQTRDHGDLDLVVDAPRAEDARHLLVRAGYELIFEDLPGHVSYGDQRDRAVDLNFAVADRYGDRWNIGRPVGVGEADYPFDCFIYGWIGGHKVGCLAPEAQLAHHLGYDIEPVDKWDAGLLRDRFDIALPEILR